MCLALHSCLFLCQYVKYEKTLFLRMTYNDALDTV
jgi:hypothetical protein